MFPKIPRNKARHPGHCTALIRRQCRLNCVTLQGKDGGHGIISGHSPFAFVELRSRLQILPTRRLVFHIYNDDNLAAREYFNIISCVSELLTNN